jgi:hypothetical protein
VKRTLSTRLFQGERLVDVRIEGPRARARRVFSENSADDVEFVLRRGQWYVKLITRSLTR